jgi:hypothetical protein
VPDFCGALESWRYGLLKIGISPSGARRAVFEALKFASEKPEKILLRFWGFAVSRRVSKV